MFTIYEGINAYSKAALTALYHECKTAILMNPEAQAQVYSVKGRQTLIRQVDAGPMGNYDKTKGWLATYGESGGIKWDPYRAPFDRAKILRVDAIDELQSYVTGSEASLSALNRDLLENQIPNEVDTVNIAELYKKVPNNNRFTVDDSGFSIDAAHILGTLNHLRSKVFDSGVSGHTVLFMSSEAYANFVTAIQDKMGLANSNIAHKTMTIVVPKNDTFDGTKYVPKVKGDTLSIEVEVEMYGNFILQPMQTSRMFSHVILASGDPDDPTQSRGGVIPDYLNPYFANVHLLAIPLAAGFVNTRYVVENFLIPASQYSLTTKVPDLRELNKKLYGNFSIENAGINQKANAFEYAFRMIYGADLYRNRARNCFSVTGKVGAQKTVTNISLAAKEGGTQVKVGETLTIEATITPTDAANKELNWSVTPGTGTASINYNGVVTGETPGTVTVVASATDGSGTKGTLLITVTEAG